MDTPLNAQERGLEHLAYAVEWPDLWAFLQALPMPVAALDAEERHVLVNPAYADFHGRRADALLGVPLAEVLGRDASAVLAPYVRKALLGQRISTLVTLKNANKSPEDVQVTYVPRTNRTGAIAGLFCFIEHSSFPLDRSLLAAIVESSDDAIVSKTLDGVITSWNQSAQRIFGYTAEEAIGQSIRLIVPPERWAEEDLVLVRLRQGERIEHFETERHAKGGRIVHISLSVSPIRNAAGEIVGACKIARDITQHRLDAESLRVSEEYRRAVLESMPECVKVLDRNGMVLHMNPAGLRMVEATSAEEVVGRCIYGVIQERDRDGFRSINESVFDGGPGGRLEFGIRGLRGAERIFETNVVPLRGEDSTVVGALSVTRDITARRQAELRDAFLVRLDDTTRTLTEPNEVIESATRMLVDHLGVDRCAYSEIDPKSEKFRVAGGYAHDLESIMGEYELALFGADFARQLKAGEVFQIEDADAQIKETSVLEAYRQFQIRAAVAVPLRKGGQVVASMAVQQRAPRAWKPNEIELLQLVANRCWESIERTRVQRELRENEQQFRNLANSIPNLAWMAHAEGDVFWYNRRWYEFTGTTPDQMEGWGWQAVHDPAVLPAVLDRWKHCIATKEPFEMVFPLRGADGQFRPFLTRVEPIRDDRNRLVRWFGTNTDIAELEEAELREKRARETAEILNRIGPMLTAELDPGRLAQTLTDIATRAVRARSGALLRTDPNRSEEVLVFSASWPGAAAHALALPKPASAELFEQARSANGVFRSDDITKDPRAAHVSLADVHSQSHDRIRSYLAVPLKSTRGSNLGYLFFGHPDPGVFTEESEQIAAGIAAQASIAFDNASLFDDSRRSAVALRQSNEQLQRANEDLNQFAYSASHDLREPLRMVSIYTQLLNRKLRGNLDAESEKYVAHVLNGAARLEALLRDLLAYTQISETPGPEVTPSDANEALARALSNLDGALEEAGATVTVVSDLPGVKIPEVRLVQLFQNLIGNAAKYRGADPPRIGIGAVREGDTWKFWVKDNGIGIADDYKTQIFGIFKRLHQPDAYSGTGIGLAICQRIVQSASGRIWVDSELGHGSTFYFTLPAWD